MMTKLGSRLGVSLVFPCMLGLSFLADQARAAPLDALTVFADELMASAIGSVLDAGEFATTAELKISFLKPVAKGLVRGEGKVLRKGKRVAFLEATIKNAKDEVVGVVTSTWTVVAG